jgi:hypothetical protein
MKELYLVEADFDGAMPLDFDATSILAQRLYGAMMNRGIKGTKVVAKKWSEVIIDDVPAVQPRVVDAA